MDGDVSLQPRTKPSWTRLDRSKESECVAICDKLTTWSRKAGYQTTPLFDRYDDVDPVSRYRVAAPLAAWTTSTDECLESHW